ncbi:MAG TPA: hypothetical protein VKA70_04690 [Blastocatellia bacterium]|nr:hypothetical protein [Blastocatellia bacterium]
MLWKSNDPNRDRMRDRLGRRLIQASQATEEEIEAAVSSPELFERIRTRAASQARPPGWMNNRVLNDWAADLLSAPLAIAWRAIPALALVATVALALWINAKGSQPDNSFGAAPAPVEIIQSEPQMTPVTACSVATKEGCTVSTDDAVAILVSATAKETNR